MAYAILKTGSKQYRVRPGDVIDVEKLPVEEGTSIELSDVLAVSKDTGLVLGSPLVADAKVLADVRRQDRDKKIIVFKYKRKVRYRRKKGHRQPYTRLAITGIVVNGEEIGLEEPPVAVAVAEEPPVAVTLVEEALDEVEAESDLVEVAVEQPEGQLETEAEAEPVEEPPEEAIVVQPEATTDDEPESQTPAEEPASEEKE
jgi:large subunit ribosomal protein L21